MVLVELLTSVSLILMLIISYYAAFVMEPDLKSFDKNVLFLFSHSYSF